VSEPDGAPLRGELSRRQAHDRGLARPVGAEEGHPLAALDDERQIFEEGIFGILVGVAHVLHLQDDPSGTRGVAEIQLHAL
jgi:hypothetical protein